MIQSDGPAPITVTEARLPDRAALDRYLDGLLESRRFTNFGPLHDRLEARLREYLGVDHLLLVGNGTLALQIACRLLDLRGTVVTTPFSFVATAHSFLWEGLRVRFCDIDENTLNLDPRKLESALDADTCAIAPVHVFGNPCDDEAISDFARKRGLPVLYDASHAFGVPVLRHGDISTLSFHATKAFHTLEGGALVLKDRALYERGRRIINHGFDGEGFPRELGINAKLNELQAAVGLCLLDGVEEGTRRRQALWERYRERLGPAVKHPRWHCRYPRNYLYCPVLFPTPQSRERAHAALQRERIDARRYFTPSLNTLPHLGAPAPMPVAESTAARILCLPLHEGLAEADADRIISLVRRSL